MDQSIIGSKNTQVGGNYTHIEGDYFQQVPPALVATYQSTKVTQHRSALAIIQAEPVKRLGLFAMFVGVVDFLGGWSSVLGLLGVSGNAANWVESVTSLLAAAAIGYVLLVIDRAYRIDGHDWYRSRDTLYLRQPDGSIEVHQITGKCPIPGCPGTLHLREPAENKEGVQLAGICSSAPGERHMFEFHDETYQGSRIERLTPVEKPK